METLVNPPRPATGLPDALIVGPQKTGSTWLHRYLEHRGDVRLPRKVKEIWFFDMYYERGLEWYARQFVERPASRTIDVSPGYFACPPVPERVSRDLGRIPVVCALRDPAERAFSFYLHMRRYGMTELSLRDAVKRHDEILDGSRYGTCLERWHRALGPERLLVLRFESLRQDPQACVDALCRHLDLPPRPVPEALRVPVNQASLPDHPALARMGWKVSRKLRSWGMHGVVEQAKRYGLKKRFFGSPGSKPVPVLSPEDRQWLLEPLAPEVEKAEGILGMDLSPWKS